MILYEVGGCVRDELLGVRSKDIDFSIVMTDDDREKFENSALDSWFDFMVSELKDQGFEIFLETPDHLTARGRFPSDHDSAHAGKAADFVLARKDGKYSDGRRPDSVEIGTLDDDLARRDFTINAIAKSLDGTIYDPFSGQYDLSMGMIRAVGSPKERLTEDALRAVRALRFSVTKESHGEPFWIEGTLAQAMESDEVINSLKSNIADERISNELGLMFRHNSLLSIQRLQAFPRLAEALFSGKVSLDSTMKTKNRG